MLFYIAKSGTNMVKYFCCIRFHKKIECNLMTLLIFISHISHKEIFMNKCKPIDLISYACFFKHFTNNSIFSRFM